MDNIAQMNSTPQRSEPSTDQQTEKGITGEEAVARGVRTAAGQSGTTI
jgi:hypothetical protein